VQQLTSGIAHIDTLHGCHCYVTCNSNTNALLSFVTFIRLLWGRRMWFIS